MTELKPNDASLRHRRFPPFRKERERVGHPAQEISREGLEGRIVRMAKNVFEDLGFSPEEAAALKLKTDLHTKVVKAAAALALTL
jgi:hypothetical protein